MGCEGGGRRALLVEDNFLISLLMIDALGGAGFEVIEAANGDRAIQVIGELDQLNLLVTDIQMPGQASGNDVARVAKSKFPCLAVIYMTGRPDSLTNHLDRRDVMLRKPFTPSELLDVAIGLLSQSEA